MRTALARHDAIVRDAIEAHGGHVVKTTGDGVLCGVRDAGGAVVAAVEAQRRARGGVVGDAGRCGCGWGCTPARRSCATATTSARGEPRGAV